MEPGEWVRRAKAVPFLVKCTQRAAVVGFGIVSDAPASSNRSGISVGLTSTSKVTVKIL